MAAPTPTVRQTPNGTKLKEGFRCLITFARKPNVEFWEKTITPPGYDGGDAIDQTTQHNVALTTKAPQSLMDVTNGQAKVAYDPKILGAAGGAAQMINVEDTVTYRFADGSTMAVFGYLKSFIPDEESRGEQPEATIEIIHTNWDPVGKVEAFPVLTEVTGT